MSVSTDCKAQCDNCHEHKPSFKIRVGKKNLWFCPTCLHLPGVIEYRIKALNADRQRKAIEDAAVYEVERVSFETPVYCQVKSIEYGDFGSDPLGLFDRVK